MPRATRDCSQRGDSHRTPGEPRPTQDLETAQKQLAKGNYDKAIAELRKLVLEDPKDVRTLLKIGDAYTRKGARKEAVETYTQVATTYAEQGFFRNALAVYMQILKLDPTRLDVSLEIAAMYEQLQLVNDALVTYEQVATAYARQGDMRPRPVDPGADVRFGSGQHPCPHQVRRGPVQGRAYQGGGRVLRASAPACSRRRGASTTSSR